MMDKKKINDDLARYCALMTEIKKRTHAITHMLKGLSTTSYKATNIEFMCLQIRKMLELISMGSLVLNKEEFEAIGQKYAQYWNARLILQDIERLNPDFYPIPILEVPSKRPGVQNDLLDKTTGFLTRDDFVKVYEKCGKMMHANNPFGSQADLDYYSSKIPEWEDLIIGLLNCHIIHLKGVKGFYIIHMQEEGMDDVRGYFFERVEDASN
jgi:hypothetical protein